MPQPGAVVERLQRRAGRAKRLVCTADDLLQEVGYRLQPTLSIDDAIHDRVEHGPPPFPRAAAFREEYRAIKDHQASRSAAAALRLLLGDRRAGSGSYRPDEPAPG